MKILVVDDEKEIADLIEIYLKNDSFEVIKGYHGIDALKKIEAASYDLAVLDVMLPGVDGFTLCSAIRKKYNYPVIMLTAKNTDKDKISGLNIGADDYVTKPFNPMELTARIKAQLRRFHQYNDTLSSSQIFESAGLEVNNTTHTCTLYSQVIPLTPTEFGILWLLCENANKVVSTEEIFEKVWGEKYLDSNNTVMVHIRRLREKMHEKTRNPKFIKTVWGVGYKIETR